MKKGQLIKSMRGFIKNTQDVAYRIGFHLKKHSPEIFMILGITGTVVSAVVACKASTKVSKILEKTKADIDTIHEMASNEDMKNEYSEEDAKKDVVIVYTQTAVQFAKLYAPAVLLGAASITSILISNNILRKRYAAVGAAYMLLSDDFKKYRERVKERWGEQIDRELKYNVKAKKIDKVVTDPETGKEKKVKENTFVVTDPSEVSGYARFFEKYTHDSEGNVIPNENWTPNNEYNIMFIKAMEMTANDRLIARKRLFLNEVYDMLGFPRSKAGQVVGWVYNSDNPKVDHYVDFGLYADNLNYSDYVYGCDPAILLDFNVDGNVWEGMQEK